MASWRHASISMSAIHLYSKRNMSSTWLRAWMRAGPSGKPIAGITNSISLRRRRRGSGRDCTYHICRLKSYSAIVTLNSLLSAGTSLNGSTCKCPGLTTLCVGRSGRSSADQAKLLEIWQNNCKISKCRITLKCSKATWIFGSSIWRKWRVCTTRRVVQMPINSSLNSKSFSKYWRGISNNLKNKLSRWSTPR